MQFARWFLQLAPALVLATAVPGWCATNFVVSLDQSQEVDSNGNPLALVDPVGATGSGTLTLVDLGGGNFRWDYSVTISPEVSFGTVSGNAALENGGRAVTGFHIHNGPGNSTGSVRYGIFGPDHDNDDDVTVVLNPDNSTSFTGSWDVADGNPAGNINDFATNFLVPAGPGDEVPFYFNVHTAQNGSGETRGQIFAVPEPTAIALVAALAGVLLCRFRP
jgi:hypothetical protein